MTSARLGMTVLFVVALVGLVIPASCCLPNGGFGDRRDAFHGKVIKGDFPTRASIAGRYDLVSFGDPRHPGVLPRIDLEIREDGTCAVRGDISALIHTTEFSGQHTPDLVQQGSWKFSHRDNDKAVALWIDVKSAGQEWYLVKMGDEYGLAIWYGDPDSYLPIEFRRVTTTPSESVPPQSSPAQKP